MAENESSPIGRVRPLIRERQIRDFTTEPPAADELYALTEVARWTGSSRNDQPWRFITVTQRETIHGLAEAYMPSSRSLQTAHAAIAIAVPDQSDHADSRAFDEGRAAERIMLGAALLGLAGAVSWVFPGARPKVNELLGVPKGWFVRTVVAIGHPTEAALKPKAAPGTARKPRSETVFSERWGA